jgi:hypothetical protein
MNDDACLNEYDRTEWQDLARKLVPGLTEAEYADMWDRFEQAKAEHERTKGLQ